jgi:hypothetical protein
MPDLGVVLIAPDEQDVLAARGALGPLGGLRPDQDEGRGLPTRGRRRGGDDFRFGAGRGAESQQIVEQTFVFCDNQRTPSFRRGQRLRVGVRVAARVCAVAGAAVHFTVPRC